LSIASQRQNANIQACTSQLQLSPNDYVSAVEGSGVGLCALCNPADGLLNEIAALTRPSFDAGTAHVCSDGLDVRRSPEFARFELPRTHYPPVITVMRIHADCARAAYGRRHCRLVGRSYVLPL
jgi:hypothetical protein